jgi:N4-gp56 family major capsid protein
VSYTPASNLTTSGTIAHLATVYYSRRALDVLRAKFRFLLATEPDLLPKRNGKTIQWYRYTKFGANTVPSAEGTVGTGITATTGTVSATISEYSDYASVSTLLEDTAIDPIVENISKELGYRAALSVDTITRAEFDSAVSSVALDALGVVFSAADLRRARAVLEGSNVEAKMGDDFVTIMHPYIVYDLKSDNTAGGFIDVMKYAAPDKLLAGEAGRIDSCRIFTTTNVGTSGTAPNVKYYTYVVGKGAVGSVELSGRGPSHVQDINKQAFKLNVVRGGPSAADPEGKIGAYVSYYFVHVAKILDSTDYRYRIVRSDASLV